MISTTWSWYVIVLAALNIFGLVWLLWYTAKRRPGDPKPDETSHYWDGDITEYNKPMPSWWIQGFYLTIVFASPTCVVRRLGHYRGCGGPRAGAAVDKAESDANWPKPSVPMTASAAQWPPIRWAGLGARFRHSCATACSSAKGSSLPNLPTLSAWRGDKERVLQTCRRRAGIMPEWARCWPAGRRGIGRLHVAYVRALATRSSRCATTTWPRKARSCRRRLRGLPCVAARPTGNRAPDLTDAYWRYGSRRKACRRSPRAARVSRRPRLLAKPVRGCGP